jgi:hypothetical protein
MNLFYIQEIQDSVFGQGYHEQNNDSQLITHTRSNTGPKPIDVLIIKKTHQGPIALSSLHHQIERITIRCCFNTQEQHQEFDIIKDNVLAQLDTNALTLINFPYYKIDDIANTFRGIHDIAIETAPNLSNINPLFNLPALKSLTVRNTGVSSIDLSQEQIYRGDGQQIVSMCRQYNKFEERPDFEIFQNLKQITFDQ